MTLPGVFWTEWPPWGTGETTAASGKPSTVGSPLFKDLPSECWIIPPLLTFCDRIRKICTNAFSIKPCHLVYSVQSRYHTRLSKIWVTSITHVG